MCVVYNDVMNSITLDGCDHDGKISYRVKCGVMFSVHVLGLVMLYSGVDLHV